MEDYHNPSRERDFEAFREFAYYVSCKTYNVRPLEEADAFAKHLADIDYSIHFHVWDRDSFDKFLDHLNTLPEWKMKLIDYSPTIGDEFIYVLERQ
jgi:hypothetical protein